MSKIGCKLTFYTNTNNFGGIIGNISILGLINYFPISRVSKNFPPTKSGMFNHDCLRGGGVDFVGCAPPKTETFFDVAPYFGESLF